jgi:hypothetical protein
VVDRADVDASSAVSSLVLSVDVDVDEVAGRDVVVPREVAVAEVESVREALRF